MNTNTTHQARRRNSKAPWVAALALAGALLIPASASAGPALILRFAPMRTMILVKASRPAPPRTVVLRVAKPLPPKPAHKVWIKGHWKTNRYGRRVWVASHWKRVR